MTQPFTDDVDTFEPIYLPPWPTPAELDELDDDDSEKSWQSSNLWLKKTRDYSCLMLEIPSELAQQILQIGKDRIPDADLSEEGRETWAHITVLYGLHTENADEILSDLNDFGPIKFTIGGISKFTGEEQDVAKFDVESDDLQRMRRIVEAHPFTDTHPEYHPHITLAYVRSGATGYGGNTDLTGQEFTADNLVFSSKNETKTQMLLDGNGTLAKFEKSIKLSGIKVADDKAAFTAKSLTNQIFDPDDWHKELIDRALPVLAVASIKAALAQMKVMGVDVRKLKEFKNCGTGDGGFKPGNVCARGGGSDNVTDTAEFKLWFGNSKVVDGEGKPKMVFHGTRHGDISIFEHGASTAHSELEYGKGFYFTDDHKEAQNYTGDSGKILNVYLKMERPFPLDGKGIPIHDLPQNVKSDLVEYRQRMMDKFPDAKSLKKPEDLVEYHDLSEFYGNKDKATNLIKRMGFDGLSDGGFTYVVFNSNQIKSATGNDGKFDPKNPDITKSYEKTFKSTASDWLDSVSDDETEDFPSTHFTTPYGNVSMKIATEMPKWMKDKIKENIEETFKQDYWEGMSITTKDEIENYLKTAISDGVSIKDMAAKIQSSLGGGDYAGWRARNIARTESGNSLNSARSASADGLIDEMGQYGMKLHKTWLSVLGTTTRRTHANLDGVPVSKDNTWTLAGIKIRWPGDIRLPAGERCNCQCTVLVDFGIDDDMAQQLIDDYQERQAEKSIRVAVEYKEWLKNCGTGAGGFKPGNTCATGGGGKPQKDEAGKLIPGTMGHTAGVDTSIFKKENTFHQWAMAKIATMEKYAAAGQWDKVAATKVGSNQYKKGAVASEDVFKSYEKLGPVAKATVDAKNNLLKQHAGDVISKPVVPPPTNTTHTWEKIGGQLGTEKGGTYMYGGEKYYVKLPDNVDRAKNEILAMKLYQLAGGHANDGALVTVNGQQGVASKWVDSEKVKWTAGDKVAAAQDFAIHAWLNNRDAVGAGTENPKDNIRLDKKGNLVLVDAGGSLEYKGQGGAGKKEFGHKADEWDSMRDASKNPTMAEVFGGMTPKQLADSANKLKNIGYNDLHELVYKHGPGTDAEKAKLVDTLVARKNEILAKAKQIEDSLVVAKKVDTSNMAIPAPPITGLSPGQQKIVQNLYETAKAGHLDVIQSIGSDPNGGPQAKQFHEYKESLLTAMKSGGKVNKDHVEPPKAEPPKVDSSKFPNAPTFKDATHAKGNADIAQQAFDHAKAGNLEALKAMALPPSGKLQQYHASLVANLANQLNPPLPPKQLAKTLDKVIEQAKNAKANGGLEKVGYWVIQGDVGGVPHGIPKGDYHPNADELHTKGLDVALKLGIKSAAQSYTGSGYASMNDALRDNNKSAYAYEGAAKLGSKIVSGGVEIPPGTLLERSHGGINYGFDATKLKPGHIVADSALLSTSFSPRQGTVQWKMTVGNGVKGLPVAAFSNYKSEDEVILPPNQKMLITHIEENGNVYDKGHIIHAIVLPTEKNQCC